MIRLQTVGGAANPVSSSCCVAQSVCKQASKLEKLAATGRFGLGFNAVYHFTDMPSFVSGEHLVIFDPHTKYLPGASSVQPGIKVRTGFQVGRWQLLHKEGTAIKSVAKMVAKVE